MRKNRISIIIFLLCFSYTSFAQNVFDEMFNQSIKDGFIWLTQEYQMLNEDGEPVSNKPGKDYRGRQHSCGVRVSSSSVLVTSNFACPWKKETAAYKKKYEMIVSTCKYLETSLLEAESLDCDVESADEVVSNHVYSFDFSEKKGFEIDDTYGKKKGVAVWLYSSNKVSEDSNPTEIKIKSAPMSITTKDGSSVYSLSSQPTGNVIGGAFLTYTSESTGYITLKVNGIFELVGGLWNMISLGVNEPDEN